MGLHGEELGSYVSFRRFAPPVDGLLAALALVAGAAMVLVKYLNSHLAVAALLWSKDISAAIKDIIGHYISLR